MSEVMGAENQGDGGEMETASLHTSFFFRASRFEFPSHLLNAYYVPETP